MLFSELTIQNTWMIFFPYTLASSPDWLYNKIFCTAWEANSVFPLAWIQEIQFLLMILAVSYGFTTVISHASFVTSSATSSVLSSSRRGEPEGLPVPWWWSWVGGGSGKHLWSKSHTTPMEGQKASGSDLPLEVNDKQMINEVARGRLSLRPGQVGRSVGSPLAPPATRGLPP